MPIAGLAKDSVVQKEGSVSVETLVSEVLRNSPEILGAEAELATAKGERRSARQWKNPEVSAEYGEKRTSDRSTGELTGKGNAQQYSFSQTFEFPGKASLRKAIADHDVKLAELALQQLHLEVAAKARSLAVEWLATEQEALTAREVADRSETLTEMLKKRAPAGVQSLLDQRIIEADLVNILTHAREAEERRDTARITLNLLRNHSPKDELHLRASLDPLHSNTEWESLWETAKASSFLIQSSEIELQKAGKSLSKAKVGAGPDITLSPFYSEERAADRERILGIGVSLPLPLWDSNRGQIEAARAGVKGADARKAAVLRDLQRELAVAIAVYDLTAKQLEKTPLAMLTRLREGADLADRQFRLGAVPVQTYIEMQDQYLQATSNLLNAIREAHDSLLKIRTLVSDPTLLGNPVKEESHAK